MSRSDMFSDYVDYKNLTRLQENRCFDDLNKENRDVIITSHLKLVLQICQRYKHLKSSLYTDLVQDGIIGLIECVDDFDPSFGNRFSTYARHRIHGRARLFIRKMSFEHNISDNKSWEFSKIMKSIPEYDILFSNPVEKVQSLLKCDRKYAQKVLISLTRMKTPSSLSTEQEDISDKEMIDMINLKKSFLPQNEKRLLEMRHEEELSWREIGWKTNMSHEGVRKKHERIIFKIKNSLESYSLIKG